MLAIVLEHGGQHLFVKSLIPSVAVVLEHHVLFLLVVLRAVYLHALIEFAGACGKLARPPDGLPKVHEGVAAFEAFAVEVLQ